MEYTQRVSEGETVTFASIGLNPCFNGIYSARPLFKNNPVISAVLILVLMEYTQRDLDDDAARLAALSGLNPCFNGIYSARATYSILPASRPGLNPCFNGIYSARRRERGPSGLSKVLILVLMEYTQRANSTVK